MEDFGSSSITLVYTVYTLPPKCVFFYRFLYAEYGKNIEKETVTSSLENIN